MKNYNHKKKKLKLELNIKKLTLLFLNTKIYTFLPYYIKKILNLNNNWHIKFFHLRN